MNVEESTDRCVHRKFRLIRVGFLLLGGCIFAADLMEASGPRSRTAGRSTPSPALAAARPSPGAEDAAALQREREQQAARTPQKTAATEPTSAPVPPSTPQQTPAGTYRGQALQPVRSADGDTPQTEAGETTWFQFPPRERRSRAYIPIKEPPRKVPPQLQQSPRISQREPERPRNAPSLETFLAKLNESADESDEVEGEVAADDSTDADNPSDESPADGERTASTDNDSDDDAARETNPTVQMDWSVPLRQNPPIPGAPNRALFADEPISAIHLNEILFYLERNDHSQAMHLDPRSPYLHFTPPVQSEFPRSRAVYEQVFREHMQTN